MKNLLYSIPIVISLIIMAFVYWFYMVHMPNISVPKYIPVDSNRIDIPAPVDPCAVQDCNQGKG